MGASAGVEAAIFNKFRSDEPRMYMYIYTYIHNLLVSRFYVFLTITTNIVLEF